MEFIETFARNYSKDSWMVRERERLTRAIERAASAPESPAPEREKP